MEEVKTEAKAIRPIIARGKAGRSSTVEPFRNGKMEGRIKKVVFVDRAKAENRAPLCATFNYEQVDVIEEPEGNKPTSCACVVI
jgi:hypothetical protein